MFNKNKKNKAVLGGKIKLVVAFKNWLHQGFFYLDRTEKFYRIIWELIPFFIFYNILILFIPTIWALLISALIAHTLNWIFNDNFWTAIMFTFPKVLNQGEEKTIEYLCNIQDRLSNYSCISGLILYGSISRGTWHNKSDIDARILRKPGVLNGLRVYLILFKERYIAVLRRQPLDIYMADSIIFLNKMRNDEFPIFLVINDNKLKKRYGEVLTTNFKSVNSINNLNTL